LTPTATSTPAVAIDQLGQLLGSLEIETTRAGYGELVAWASQFGTLDRFGVEGTGSFGGGLARWLRAQGLMFRSRSTGRTVRPAAAASPI
jgi:hypothetical protein